MNEDEMNEILATLRGYLSEDIKQYKLKTFDADFEAACESMADKLLEIVKQLRRRNERVTD